MSWWYIFTKAAANKKAWVALVGLFIFLTSSTIVYADLIETLVMPGKVVAAHKKYESECKRCHQKLGTKGDSKLCLTCHKRVASDVHNSQGFHGRAPGVRTGECRVCHTEHIGRDGDIVKFSPDSFDHRNTDFPLVGAHQQATCDACHKPKLKYRDANQKCIQCHRKKNPHGNNLGKIDKKLQGCDSCHNSISWQAINFKHKLTSYELTGKHKTLVCAACHKNDHFHNTEKTCYGCHRINDVHKGSQGIKCVSCHNTREWKIISFNHDKTKFPLRGKHKKQVCQACHLGDPKKEKLPTTCISCHRQDDVHTTRFGTKCDKCHAENDWAENTFSHSKSTKYPLKGKHREQECQACHKGNIYTDKLKTQCYACHKLDDVHQNKQGKICSQCHNESGWNKKVIFEHDATRFPLIGLHAVTPCEECHLNAKYQDTKKECVACHEMKDIHKGTLGTQCQMCHTPNAWNIWVFDHDKQTDFKLTGKHKKLTCRRCHYKPLAEMKSNVNECISCHAGDDIHHGQFGSNCQRCHTTEKFQDLKDFH